MPHKQASTEQFSFGSAMNIQNILLATDFSASSQAALQYAALVTERFNAHLVVAHVISESAFKDVPTAILADAKNRTIVETRRRLEQLRESLNDFEAEFILEEGPVADKLLLLAESKSVDFLIVGTRGHSGIKRLLLGSVAEKLSRQARCPVLVVPDSAVPYKSEVSTLRRFLCPTNFSPRSVTAIKQALEFAKSFSAQLILLHVVEEPALNRADRIALRTAVEERLSGFSSRLSANGPSYEAELVVEFGSPAEIIVKVAAERDADLIALSIQRAKAAVAHLAPEITYSVVQQADRPVLTIAS